MIERDSEYLLSVDETDEDYRTKESRLAEKPETLRQLCEGGGPEKWSREGERSIKIEAFRIEKNCFRLNDKKNLGNKENRMFFLVHSIPDVRMICKSIFLHILEVPPRKRASFAI